MGISQGQIDAEITNLREIRQHASFLKKVFFPKDIARELDSFIDNFDIYPLYRAIDNCKESFVDSLEDFRLNSKILLLYYKYVEYLEENISEQSRAAVFANMLLANDLLELHNYIVSYCVQHRDKQAFVNYVAIYGDGEVLISLFAKLLPNLAKDEILYAWDICKILKPEQVNTLLACEDLDAKFTALLKLESIFIKNQLFVDSIINSSKPMLTMSLIHQLSADGYCSDFLMPLVEKLLIKAHDNTECVPHLLESMCAGLKFLEKTERPLPEEFKEKALQHAEIIFNRQTDVLWQYVPLNILDQLYQVVFSICEDDDIVIIEGLSEIEVKQSMVVSAFLDLEKVLFGKEVLLSGEYDERLYPQACVAFTQIGVCLNDIRARTQFDSKKSDPLLCLKFLPYLIRANSLEYNCVVLSYFRLPEVRALWSRVENGESCISVADILSVAKEHNQELYLQLCNINKTNSSIVSVAEFSFVVAGAAKKVDETTSITKNRSYTY